MKFVMEVGAVIEVCKVLAVVEKVMEVEAVIEVCKVLAVVERVMFAVMYF